MFTGLVEELGTITDIKRTSNGFTIAISCKEVLDDLKVDDSIAVNGVCQTVVEVSSGGFSVNAISETINRTTFYSFSKNQVVNLERAISLNTRLGGHIVQGHVDCKAIITNVENNGLSVVYTLRPEQKYFKYIIDHGSVCLDGISLTVQNRLEGCFTVSIIPHTMKNTNVSRWKTGKEINFEADVLGKYVENFINGKSSLTLERLQELGF
ncbi:MAG: riboflavin synthase [Candidatus Delongbacteria bacterium]|nr:riboflavin synthase [Candidatus Delongbacteria bacterium]MBN2836229.1 riboflavin synthase [Candidatus Delongbacteria bacterium]